MSKMERKLLPDYKKIDGFCVPGCFSEETWKSALDFKPRPGNIFLATYPKSGTNWTQQILLLIVKKGVPPTNAFEFYNECPHIDMSGLDTIDQIKDPQLIKIHLPFNMAPYSPEAKYIVVVRNPKDCVVSYYHQTATELYDYVEGKFDDYFELFLDGAVDYGDYFKHVLSWNEHRNDSNVLFLYYEEMKKDIESTILKIAEFMGPQHLNIASDPIIMANIIKFSGFEYMRDVFNKQNEEFVQLGLDPKVSPESLPIPRGYVHAYNYLRNRGTRTLDVSLVRKGVAGGWRNTLNDEQNRKMNEKIESKLKGTEMLKIWIDNGCI